MPRWRPRGRGCLIEPSELAGLKFKMPESDRHPLGAWSWARWAANRQWVEWWERAGALSMELAADALLPWLEPPIGLGAEAALPREEPSGYRRFDPWRYLSQA